jgi:hypothetical protein
MTIVDDGVSELTACGGCGGGGEAVLRWAMVEGVMSHEGATSRRESTLDDGWRQGRASDSAEAGGGEYHGDRAPPLPRASVEAPQ